MNESSPGRAIGSFTWGTTLCHGYYGFPYCSSESGNVKTEVSWTNSRIGQQNPSWRIQVASGQNATTPFAGTKFKVRAKQTQSRVVWDKSNLYYSRPGESSLTGDLLWAYPNHTNTSSLDAALNEAKRKFINEAKQYITPFQGGVFLGELTKTLTTLRNPALSMRRLIDDYFRELKRVPQRLSSLQRRKALASTYLEYTYAWKPLAYDVEGAVKALQTLSTIDPPIKVISGRGAHEGLPQHTTGSATFGGSAYKINYTQVRRSTSSAIIKGGVKTESFASGSWPSVIGFSAGNFLPTAWELLPWSFLIDYFTNIGSIIDAWAMVSSQVTWSCQTTRQTTSYRADTTSIDMSSLPYPDHVDTVFFQPGSMGIQRVDVERTSSPSLVPGLAFRLPGIGSTQALNVAVLAHQGFVRRPFY